VFRPVSAVVFAYLCGGHANDACRDELRLCVTAITQPLRHLASVGQPTELGKQRSGGQNCRQVFREDGHYGSAAATGELMTRTAAPFNPQARVLARRKPAAAIGQVE
jgi:hypothetical protein